MRHMEVKGAVRAAIVFSAGFSALALAAPAWAQDSGTPDSSDQRDDSSVTSDAQDAAGKEIIATGFAARLQRAIENKRNLDVISHVPAAAHTGKSPTPNHPPPPPPAPRPP